MRGGDPRSDDAVDFGVLVTPDRIDFGPQLDKPSRSFGMQMRGRKGDRIRWLRLLRGRPATPGREAPESSSLVLR